MMKKSLLAASLLAALTLVACGKKDDAPATPPKPSSTMPADPASVPPATPGAPSGSTTTPGGATGTTGTTR